MPSLADAYRLFHRGAIALAEVEASGIRIDMDHLNRSIADCDERIVELREGLRKSETAKAWKKRFGEKTNFDSRIQLGEVVFGMAGHPPNPDLIPLRGCERGKTKTGQWRTDEGAFDHLNVPFVKDFVRLEKVKKCRNTFLEGIRREVVGGFLHPMIHLSKATTYRSSSSLPNFQNLPIRDPEFAEVIRKCFIPREGNRFVEPDFGALEFAIAACFWKDERIIEYASDPTKDIHRDMAAKIWKCPKEGINKTSRYVGKNQFTFPELYGSYYVKMAQALWQAISEHDLKVGEVPIKEWLYRRGTNRLGNCDPKMEPEAGTFERHIKEVEEHFNQKMFPEFGRKKEEWWNEYKKTGEFRLMTGFRIGGVNSKNFLLNSPIQGPAFHILLESLILAIRKIKKRKMKSLVVGEIHDCILADVPERETQDFLNMIKEIMTKEVPATWNWIICPLKVEVDCSQVDGNWFEKSPWEERNGKWTTKAS